MAFTKVVAAGIGSTGTVILQNLTITGILTAANFQGNISNIVVSGATTTTNLNVTGNLSGNGFESYELDDLSSATNGQENTFVPTFNYDRVTITNPFKLMITVNGIPQSAFINNTDYVYQSIFLGLNNGFTIDTDNNIKFTESLPLGSEVVARVLPAPSTTTRFKYYPFKPAEILLGY